MGRSGRCCRALRGQVRSSRVNREWRGRRRRPGEKYDRRRKALEEPRVATSHAYRSQRRSSSRQVEDASPAFLRGLFLTALTIRKRLVQLTKGSWALGIFESYAIHVAPVVLPAPSAPSANRVALNVYRGMLGRERLFAENAARRGTAAETAATLACLEEGFPRSVDYLVLR